MFYIFKILFYLTKVIRTLFINRVEVKSSINEYGNKDSFTSNLNYAYN